VGICFAPPLQAGFGKEQTSTEERYLKRLAKLLRAKTKALATTDQLEATKNPAG
jgi:hypothetical protein